MAPRRGESNTTHMRQRHVCSTDRGRGALAHVQRALCQCARVCVVCLHGLAPPRRTYYCRPLRRTASSNRRRSSTPTCVCVCLAGIVVQQSKRVPGGGGGVDRRQCRSSSSQCGHCCILGASASAARLLVGWSISEELRHLKVKPKERKPSRRRTHRVI